MPLYISYVHTVTVTKSQTKDTDDNQLLGMFCLRSLRVNQKTIYLYIIEEKMMHGMGMVAHLCIQEVQFCLKVLFLN